MQRNPGEEAQAVQLIVGEAVTMMILKRNEKAPGNAIECQRERFVLGRFFLFLSNNLVLGNAFWFVLYD